MRLNRPDTNLSVRRKQRGFIHAAVLAGLLLLVVVAAGMALANRQTDDPIDSERARIQSSTILKQANLMTDALRRAAQDNVRNYQSSAAFVTSLVSGGYLVEPPVLPGDAWAAPAWISYGQAALGNQGTAAADSFIAIHPISDLVCMRINAALWSEPTRPDRSSEAAWTAGVPVLISASWQRRGEGCLRHDTGGANANVYFKVVEVR